MRERLTAILERIRELWSNASKKARILFLSSVSGILILALVLTILLNRKEYITLYNDLSTPDSAQVIAVLAENAIPYTVDHGRILVDIKDEGRARLQLAVLGFEDAGFKYDLAKSGGLTATQQDKDRDALFALQDRLQATIELFPEVERAVVTISMPNKNAFALQSEMIPSTASVVITKKPRQELTAEQVQGIVNIVCASVEGLTEANLSISDERGDLRSMLDLNQDYNNKKLNLTEQVNRSISNHIKQLVQQPYGPGNVEVVVMTKLNTDSRVAEQTTYQPIDPENPTNNPLDYAEYDRQRTGDGFPAAGGVPGAQDNVGTPQYAAQEADAANSDYYSGHDVYDYLVSSLREQIVKDGFAIEEASAAILVNATNLPDGERDALITLAANASGIARENITVQSIKFHTDIVEPRVEPESLTRYFIISGIALLALCIILIIVLTSISRRRARRQAELEAEAAAAAEALQYDENGVPLIDLMNQEEDYGPIELVESSEQKLKLQIKDLAETDPEIVAQLIKTWLVSSK